MSGSASAWPRPGRGAGLALIGAVIGSVIGAAIASTAAHAQGVAYEVAPVGVHVRWDEALGLLDDELLGGRLGFRFGPLAELQGYYLQRDGVRADASRLPVVPGFSPPADTRPVRVQSYGADLRVNLLNRPSTPFVTGGGGVLRLSPADGDVTEQILLRAGGGLRFGLVGGLSAQLTAESWAFRLNRFNLFAPAGAFDDPDGDETRYSLVVGAGVNVPLGGDVTGAPPRTAGTSIHLEPMAGRLEFDDALGLPRQNLFGARAGLELHRLVGLRGFYWRGADDDFSRTEPVQGFGAEVQFNLASGLPLVPHLIAGAGRIEFRDGYGDPGAPRPADQTKLILGAGLSLELGSRFQATAAARDYILSEFAHGELRRTDQLSHNWMFSLGLGVAVGGREPVAVPVPVRTPRPLTEVERLRLENERLRRLERERLAAGTEWVAIDPETGEVVSEVAPGTRTERTMLVPVPEVGEIYIRYGPGTGMRPQALAPAARVDPLAGELGDAPMTQAELRALIRDAVRAEVLQQPGAPIAPGTPQTEQQRLAQLEQRLVERLEAEFSRRLREQRTAPGQAAPGTTLIVPRDPLPPASLLLPPARERPAPPLTPPPPARPVEPAEEPPVPVGLRPWHGRPYAGTGLTGDRQWVLGGRLNLGQPVADVPVSLVPDAAASFGAGASSFMLALHGQYDFLPPDLDNLLAPYVLGGIGLWQQARTELTLNAGYGISVRALTSPTRPLRVFIEHQGVSLFRRNRVLIGTQLGL